MKCTQFAHDLDGDVFDVPTTTMYDADGNVVSVIEENATNYLTEDDGADEPLVFGTGGHSRIGDIQGFSGSRRPV